MIKFDVFNRFTGAALSAERPHYLGQFVSCEAASRAYRVAAQNLFGQFARTP